MEDPEVPIEHLQEEIHHRAAHDRERWIMGVALSSALLASLAAVVSMSAGHYSTEAMVGQIESANQWSYFQSKSIKESQLTSKTELLEALGKPISESDSKKAAEYRGDKEKIQKKAEELAVEARSSLSTHHILARSVTMFQIAIAIGAISVLTKRRAYWFVSLCFGGVGLVFVAQVLLGIHSH
jgi:hypothetical protein